MKTESYIYGRYKTVMIKGNLAYKLEEEQTKEIMYTRERTSKEQNYLIKQRIQGIILILMGVIAPFLLDGDATSSLLLIPAGIVVLKAKTNILM